MSFSHFTDGERVRLPLERILVERLAKDVGIAALRDRREIPEPEAIRRQLLGRAVRLTQAMSPAAVQLADEVRNAFGLTAAVEIYQSAGQENAAIHLLREPILLEVQGRLLSLLDAGALKAVVGHEIGHFIAHGPDSPEARTGILATSLAVSDEVPAELAALASTLSMARELTADRYALLATGNLADLLRLEMVATTGLPADALGNDTSGYLAQCRELVESCLEEGGTALGLTHPEHGVRAWAAWLFSESDLFHELTGAGSGNRPIAEVNALVEKILHQTGLDGSYQYMEPPPPELHELALAAAVLVGLADGTLSDEEAEIIEKVFAPLVPGWRDLLDAKIATRRFEELRPLAAAFGTGFHRSLFNLLLHVVAADGVADAEELRTVEEIGTVLGCGELFAVLLRGVRRRITVEQRDNARAQPLPVRPQDASSALEAYFASVIRRGGTQVILRTLLRLLGASNRDAEAIARLEVTLQRAGLECTRDLKTARLDESVVLRPAARASQTDAQASRPPPGALERAIQRLRDELISGDGNSPSVRMRDVRLGRACDLAGLSLISVGHAERCLAIIQSGRRVVLVSGEQAGLSKEAAAFERQLVELRREHLGRLEETGARDLYVGLGFVCGCSEAYVVRAPLLLIPAELERIGEGGIALVPLPDEQPVANQAVFRAIHHKAGLPFGEETAAKLDAMAADPGQGVPALIEHLRSAGFDVFEVSSELHPLDDLPDAVYEWKGRRLESEACAVLGLFPQSSSELLEDYEQLLSDLARPDADPGRLLGCARELLPASLRGSLPSEPFDPRNPELPVVAVIPSDPSQVEVVRMARTTPALVVDGPPGTGKSQVIVNLVADALARGERVAVVSEKRAALDVVANRMAHAGLGDLLGVVHDVFEDRKALYARIHARLTKEPGGASAPPPALDSRDLLAGGLRERIAHLRDADAEGPGTGTLAAYAAGLAGVVPAQMPSIAGLPLKEAVKLSRLAAECRPWTDLLAGDTPWRPASDRPSRRSLAGTRPDERKAMEQALARAAETAARVEALAGRQEVSPAAVAASLNQLKAADAALAALKDVGDETLIARLLAKPDGASLRSLASLRTEWTGEAGAWRQESSPVRCAVPEELEPAVLTLLAKGDSVFRLLSPAWWKAGGTVRQAMPRIWPDALGRKLDTETCRGLHRRIRLARLWARLDSIAAETGLGDVLSGDASDISHVLDRAAAAAGPLRALHEARAALEAVRAWRPGASSAWRELVGERIALAESWLAHNEAARGAAGIFFDLSPGTPAAHFEARRARFSADAERVAELDRHLDETSGVTPAGPVVAAVCADTGAGGRWTDLVLKAWAGERVRAKRDQLPPRLRGGATDDTLTLRLSETLETDAIARRHSVLVQSAKSPLLKIPPAEKFARRTPEQAAREKLQKETARQRGLMPLRPFVRAYAEQGLFDVLPVWLLSPETLAVLFPRKPVFDLVIFDEASQCTVASGFPALLRTKRVIVAGDDRQMPPTSFFKASREEDETGGQDQKAEPADFLDAESLLTLARQRMAARSLGWHYRCREEELIAFSNHAMYGGALLTCPSLATPLQAPALRWLAVPDAIYADGRNEKEAERVVDVLADLLTRKPAPTVGVVTFNLSQRRTVLDAIDRRRGADPEFARLYAEAESRELVDDRPFVKNIENVQGDERDVIVFSLGHAPVERRHKTRGVERYVPARFGPIGQRGGERRLNVAVSRARAETLVVASFQPDQLSVARAKNDGPRLFKAYLEFVHHLSSGARTLANRTLDLVRSSAEGKGKVSGEPLPGYIPLAGQVADALLVRGHKAAVGVGASGFKVDIAIEGDVGGKHYRVAVLCDEGSADDGAYRRTQRAALLRRRGWRLVHVDSVEWFDDRNAVLARIERAIRE